MRVGYWKSEPPCAKCENKGCGVYHDKCEAYRKFREESDAVKEEMRKKTEIKIATKLLAENVKKKGRKRKK